MKQQNVMADQQELDNVMQAKAAKLEAENKGETISDDAPVGEELMNSIKQQEALVRDALAVFGIDYDEMISMQGNSIYARAVKSEPRILEHVIGSASPVVEALKVATNFKPYVSFTEKYGNEPEAIKAAIRKEIEDELAGRLKSKQQDSSKTQNMEPAFSKVLAGAGRGSSKVTDGEQFLAGVFKKG